LIMIGKSKAALLTASEAPRNWRSQFLVANQFE
jgi:hypothetical protein